MKVFLTFGDAKYERSLRRIEREARDSGFFDRIAIKRPDDLGEAFWDKHGRMVRYCRRGYGYWLWKPYLILEQLLQCEPDDILVYADAGCTVNAKGRARFEDHCRLLRQSQRGVLGFQMSLKEKRYTKGDAFAALDAWHLADTGQVSASVSLWRRCDASIAFAREWLALAERYQLITDTPSVTPNDPRFVEHRHDQSLFSLLAKLRGVTLIKDETYPVNWDMPFLATRRRDRTAQPLRRLERALRKVLRGGAV